MINVWNFDDKVRLKEFWTMSPYYSSKTLLQYFENTIEKKYHLKWDEIWIYIQMKKSDEWKIPLKGRIEVIINWKKKEFRFDFSNETGLPDQLLSLRDNIENFVSENKIPWMIYKNLNTKNHILSKRWDIINFPDGSFVDTSNIKLDDVRNHKDCWFIYGSNLAWILWWWQAMYWSEANAFWIPTRPDLEWYFSDKDFFQLKPEIDKSFEKIFDFLKRWKPIIIPANWVWTWFARLQENAPTVLNYINSKLNEIKEFNNKHWLITNNTSSKQTA